MENIGLRCSIASFGVGEKTEYWIWVEQDVSFLMNEATSEAWRCSVSFYFQLITLFW